MYNEEKLFGARLTYSATPDQVAVLQRVGNTAHAAAMKANPDIAEAMAIFDDIDKEVANRNYGDGELNEEETYEEQALYFCTKAESEAADLARRTHGIEQYVFNADGRRIGQQTNSKGSKAAGKISRSAKRAASIERRIARHANSARLKEIRDNS